MTADARTILAERARALARPATAPAAGDTLQLVSFALGNERCAVEARYTFAAFRAAELAPLPGAPQPVFGLTSWRGQLLTVVDLRATLGVASSALADLTHVIVLGEERPVVGMLAGAPLELVTLPAVAVQQPRGGGPAPPALLRGVTPDALLVLDAHALLRHHA